MTPKDNSTRQHIPPRLLTPDDVALRLGVPRLTVIRATRTGRIPAIKFGRVYRYRAETIDRWLMEQEAVRENECTA